MPLGATYLECMDDFLLWYSKDKPKMKYRPLWREQDVQGMYYWGLAELKNGMIRRMTKDEVSNHQLLPTETKVARLVSIKPPTFSPKSVFPIKVNGVVFLPSAGSCWIGNPDTMSRLLKANRLMKSGSTLMYFYKISDFTYTLSSVKLQRTGPIWEVVTLLTIKCMWFKHLKKLSSDVC